MVSDAKNAKISTFTVGQLSNSKASSATTPCSSNQSFSANNSQYVAQGPNAKLYILQQMFTGNEGTMRQDQTEPNKCTASSCGSMPIGSDEGASYCLALKEAGREILKYCEGASDLEHAVAQLKLCGVSFRQKRGSAVFFNFRRLSQTEDGKRKHQKPLLFTGKVSISLFGETFKKAVCGLEDFPAFQDAEEDARSLYKAITSKKTNLGDIRVGKHLMKLAERCPKWFTAADGSRPSFLAYREIVDDEEMTDKQQKLIKFVNGQIIAWMDADNRGKLCECGEKPRLLHKGSTCQLIYKCGRWFSGKEIRCHYMKDFWMSQQG